MRKAIGRGTGAPRRVLDLAKGLAMEPLYYVMAILGCGDDGAACQQARIDTARYQSAAQCQAAMSAALERHADLSYPVIQVTCQRRGLDVAAREAGRQG